jgi:hypothetical protein
MASQGEEIGPQARKKNFERKISTSLDYRLGSPQLGSSILKLASEK